MKRAVVLVQNSNKIGCRNILHAFKDLILIALGTVHLIC